MARWTEIAGGWIHTQLSAAISVMDYPILDNGKKFMATKKKVNQSKATAPKVKGAETKEPEKPSGTKRFTPEDIERRVKEAQALAGYQTPETHLLNNLLDTLKAEDKAFSDECEKAKARILKCFGYAKDVSKKTMTLKQSITERHFEAGETLEKMAWLLRGCFDTWRKSERLPETTSYRARELYKAAKDIDAIKGMTLTEAYAQFNILQRKQPTLDKLLISVEKTITRVINSDVTPADAFEASNCSSTIQRCLDRLNKAVAAIKSMAAVEAEAITEPVSLKKTEGKKKLKPPTHQLMA